CTTAGQCNGCTPNTRCTGAGVPVACCTGVNQGTCPLLGSCAVVQNKNSVVVPRIALNGVCVPRNGANGDLGCTLDADCRSCVGGTNDGLTCLPGQGAPGSGQQDPCPGGGTCTGTATTCQLPELTMEVGPTDPGTGEAQVTIPKDSLVLMPAAAGSIGTVCVKAGSDGVGVLDCNGGRPNLDVTLSRDHNLIPGSPGNSGSANGLPDDPECDDNYVLPDASLSRPCVEGTARCNSGTNQDMLCTVESDCPPVDPEIKRCALCNTATITQHPGICNSPTKVELSGTYNSGGLLLSMPLALTVLKGAVLGPDNLPCTPDDTANPASPVGVLLSSGTSIMRMYDVNNIANNKIAPGETCPIVGPCVAQLTGTPVASCSSLYSLGDPGGLQLSGGFGAFDIDLTLDLVTVFQFKLVKP
ncbi:hypothetical protein L6Q96_23140, partial [Candidatus Binatia bacterium]|nr:hypothetical protein [Candidatus Binatia bacterium]